MKTGFAILSIAFGFAAFAPYFLEMWRGTVKPHIFSWITWTLLTGLGFVLSFFGGGGGGSWVFGVQAVFCFVVVVYALFRGERNITRFDRITFGCALAITVIYVLTKNAPLSAFLAATIDTLGFASTFRKSFAKPFSEPMLTYVSSGMGYLFSLGALEYLNFVTVFYPSILIATNGLFVLFLLVRRRAVEHAILSTPNR